MSNIIQIKRGSGTPSNNSLAPYELGYDTDGRQLFIGHPSDPSNTGEITVYPQVIGSSSPLPVTTLMKDRKSKKENQVLQIYCEGLVPGEEYTICLYTLQKSRGNSSRYWRHPSNTKPIKEVDGEQIVEFGKFTGYANMADQIIDGHVSEVNRHPSIPDWMPRGGVLQTEWPPFKAEAEAELHEIPLNEWILDLLKPIPSMNEWGLIGLANDKQDTTGRAFQFRLLTEDERVGTTNSTLVLSRVHKTSKDDGSVSIGFFSIR